MDICPLHAVDFRLHKNTNQSERFSCVSLYRLLRDTREPPTLVCSLKVMIMSYLLFKCNKSDCPCNLIGTQTSWTYINCLRSSVVQYSDFFHIRFPESVSPSNWVANIITEYGIFAANLTFCHLYHTSFGLELIIPQSNNYFNTLMPISARAF